MDLIKALIKVKYNLKESDIGSSQKLDEFERLILENPNITADEVCLKIYGNVEKSSDFRVLKHRLEQKLQDDIFLASGCFKNLNNFNFRSLVADKNNIIISSIYKNGFQKVAVKLAEKNLDFCKENFLTESAIAPTIILMNYYGFLHPNYKLFEKALNDNRYFTEIFNAENVASRYNAIISHWYVIGKGGFDNEQISQVKSMLDELKILKSQHVSWIIHFTYYSTANFFFMLIGEYSLSLSTAQEGIQSCDTIFITDKMMRYRCIINVGLSYFYLKQYCDATTEYKKAMAIVPEGHRLWFEDALIFFTILLRAKYYGELYDLFKSRIEHKNLKNNALIEEQWKIREAFIEFLIEAKIVSHNESIKTKSKTFSVNKFLNSVTFYTKDKAGIHIQVIIIKILFLLQKKQYDNIENLTDSLNQYIYKYLNRKEAMRSFYFIKLLIKMVDVGFHPIRVKAHTKNIESKLKAISYVIDQNNNMVEMLPYEDLWQIIIDLLENNVRK